MSSLERPPDDWMVTVWSLPVDLSLALTCTIPLASMSKVTSICGTPLGAGGMPERSNCPSSLLSATISLSPWKTLMVTVVWLSAAVEQTCDFLVGMVVFLGIILVITPPRVSMPSERGVTSSKSKSFMSPLSTPPWMAAPTATASSGFTDLLGTLSKIFWTSSTTLGMRVMPPTRITSSILFLGTSESLMQFSQGLMVLLRKSSVKASSLALVSLKMKCLGPEASAVRKGKLTSVWVDWESSILAFSAASLSLWLAVLSLETSRPDCFLNSSSKNRWTMPSMSSPPHEVSPLVALTSMTPWEISRMEISNVPPPKSYTAMVLSSFFSIPQAKAAAVGSLMILSTSNPAIFPASLVACLCESLKQAGTVMTARSTVFPRQLSAVSFIFMRTKAPIWEGEQGFPCTSTHASPLECLMILQGMFFLSFWTDGSSNLLPISLLVAKTVFSELVMACLLAAAPTIFSPSLVKATTDGVVLLPSAFSITLGVLPSMTATQELVVPRSMPMMAPLPLAVLKSPLAPRLNTLNITQYYSSNQNQVSTNITIIKIQNY